MADIYEFDKNKRVNVVVPLETWDKPRLRWNAGILEERLVGARVNGNGKPIGNPIEKWVVVESVPGEQPTDKEIV